MASVTTRRALVDPGSPSAEAFRSLRLALQLRVGNDRQPAVLVTSAEPSAGKSTAAANFALVSALAQSRVLLIDADLRRPVQHEIFGLSRSPGLVELLALGGPISQFVQRSIAGVDILTAGRDVVRTGDITSSVRMGEVLAEAAEMYDIVVVDSPPVLAAADVEGIASHGGVEIVFVADKNSRGRAVVKAIRRLERIDADIAGIVLNREGQQDLYGY